MEVKSGLDQWHFLSRAERDWGMGQPSSPEVYRKRFIKRFWAKVDKTPGLGPNGDCWEWRGSQAQGYGQIGIIPARLGFTHLKGNPCPIRAHAAAWVIVYGHPLPPKGWHVCHECNNKSCVREEHLWPGTPADNVHHAQATGLTPKVDHEKRERELDAQARTEREFIDRHLNLVAPRQQDILKRRFGYTHKTSHTLQEIGDRYGITRERIRQLQDDALETILMFTIEKDIPIPPPKGRDAGTEARETFEAMDPGDSFELEANGHTINKIRQLAKRRGYMIATRTIGPDKVRIWLISKPETESKAA